MSTVQIQKQRLSDSEILAVAGEFYVGYNREATLDTAIGTVGRRFNQKLGTSFSHGQLVEMMKSKNVIDCGGLNNYMICLFKKMEEKAS